MTAVHVAGEERAPHILSRVAAKRAGDVHFAAVLAGDYLRVRFCECIMASEYNHPEQCNEHWRSSI